MSVEPVGKPTRPGPRRALAAATIASLDERVSTNSHTPEIAVDPGLLVLAGPPGSGKGTQAALLASCYDLEHVNTGALLRREIASQSDLGRKVEPYVQAGMHTPTDLLNGMIVGRIESAGSAVVLDGYPRNLAQAAALDAALQDTAKSILAVVGFELDDESVIERLAGRIICEAEGHAYHRSSRPPARAGTCDLDGSPLVARQDDRDIVAIKSRLALYRARTVPLLDQYDEQGILLRIDAHGSPSDVANSLSAILPESVRHRLSGAQIHREADPDRPHTRVRSGASGWAA